MATTGTRRTNPRNESFPPARLPSTGTGVGGDEVVVVVDPLGGFVEAPGPEED
jgi:hypothetical protein